MPEETEPASLGRLCWPREQASSGLATGRALPGPWGGGRRPAPDTPSPTDTAESPGNGRRIQGSTRLSGRNGEANRKIEIIDNRIYKSPFCAVHDRRYFKQVL